MKLRLRFLLLPVFEMGQKVTNSLKYKHHSVYLEGNKTGSFGAIRCKYYMGSVSFRF